MDLVVFGDSWTYGDELVPDTPQYRNSVNIGGLVYKNYSFNNYHNYSANGASLNHIILHILDYLESENYSDDNFIMVGLTSPMRLLRFNNIVEGPTNWSSHDYNEFCNYCDKRLVSDDFKKWWELNLKFNVNVRNDLINYFNSCFTIKSLLSSHSKYIVWQSIDGGLYDMIEEYAPIISDYETYTSKETIHKNNELFFNKEVVNRNLKKNTLDTQMWINIEETSWVKWLENNSNGEYSLGMHPNEKGIQIWFDDFLKKYLDKILDN